MTRTYLEIFLDFKDDKGPKSIAEVIAFEKQCIAKNKLEVADALDEWVRYLIKQIRAEWMLDDDATDATIKES